jgi:hypothetical protein
MEAVMFHTAAMTPPMMWALMAISALSILVCLPSFRWTWTRAIAAAIVLLVVIVFATPHEMWGIYIYWPWDWWPYCFC